MAAAAANSFKFREKTAPDSYLRNHNARRVGQLRTSGPKEPDSNYARERAEVREITHIIGHCVSAGATKESYSYYRPTY